MSRVPERCWGWVSDKGRCTGVKDHDGDCDVDPSVKQPKRPFYQTMSVEVNIDASILEENGYHHEEDCQKSAGDEHGSEQHVENSGQKLKDWHDQKHGIFLWSMCMEEPCNVLTYQFRDMF